ncbi:hypothetical protein QN224_29530, partial [Sinorhizobium sp. 8-89]|uniref:hypothetical protein n=1 Tax=Sinorhizobium sp. 7-81 TaxID=3049087 RepID=UPI0024C2B1B5
MQAGREQQRSNGGPRRTGQTDHMFGIRDGSQSKAGAIRRRPACATLTSSSRSAACVCVLFKYVHLRGQ